MRAVSRCDFAQSGGTRLAGSRVQHQTYRPSYTARLFLCAKQQESETPRVLRANCQLDAHEQVHPT